MITHFQTRKAALLLAKLGMNMERSCSRDELIETLWPDEYLDAARERFRQTLSSLRKALTLGDEEPPIKSDRLTVKLDSSRVASDVAEFERGLKSSRLDLPIQERLQHLERAIQNYEGPLLQGYSEEWILSERSAYELAYVESIGRLAELYAKAGDLQAAITQARRAVEADPLREESRQTLIGLLGRAGRSSEAVRQFKEYENLVQRELGAKPSRALSNLVAEVQAGSLEEDHAVRMPDIGGKESPEELPKKKEEASRSGSSGPPSSRPASPPIDVPLTKFFGREEELEMLDQLVGSSASGEKDSDQVRLVTLTGPGGCGKTRLALHFARNLLASGGDLVCYVPLVGLTDASSIPETIRERLHLINSPDGDAFDAVLAAFQSGPSLLVLDNFEHLVDDGSELIERLLRSAHQLRIIATSRRRLGIWAEQELPVPPLPTPHRPGSPEETLRYPSVKLFVDRVKKVRPTFALDESNVHAVTALCEFLEGIPLALELAAARAGVLSPEQLLGQLEDRFDFLASRQKDVPERHRTLRAAIEWSYLSLDSDAQRFFRTLTVFRGTWTLEAAQSVSGEPLALDFLEELRDRCLIVPEAAGSEMGFRILETLRAYGEEMISDEERREAEQAHVRYYSQKATEYQEGQFGEGYSTVVPQMMSRWDNVRRALEIALNKDRPMPEEAVNIVRRLYHFFEAVGMLREGTQYGMRALELYTEPTIARRKAMGAIAALLTQLNDYDNAIKLAREELELAEKLDNEEELYYALGSLLVALSGSGNVKESQLYEKRILPFIEKREPTVKSLGYTNLGNAAFTAKRYEDCRRYYELALEAAKKGTSERELAFSYTNLGQILLHEEEFAKAKEYFELGMAVMRRAKLNLGIYECLRQLGEACIRLDDSRKRALEVVRVLAAQDRMRTEIGVPIVADYLPGYLLACDIARERLGDDEFEKAWADGRQLDMPQAIEAAMRW